MVMPPKRRRGKAGAGGAAAADSGGGGDGPERSEATGPATGARADGGADEKERKRESTQQAKTPPSPSSPSLPSPSSSRPGRGGRTAKPQRRASHVVIRDPNGDEEKENEQTTGGDKDMDEDDHDEQPPTAGPLLSIPPESHAETSAATQVQPSKPPTRARRQSPSLLVVQSILSSSSPTAPVSVSPLALAQTTPPLPDETKEHLLQFKQSLLKRNEKLQRRIQSSTATSPALLHATLPVALNVVEPTKRTAAEAESADSSEKDRKKPRFLPPATAAAPDADNASSPGRPVARDQHSADSQVAATPETHPFLLASMLSELGPIVPLVRENAAAVRPTPLLGQAPDPQTQGRGQSRGRGRGKGKRKGPAASAETPTASADHAQSASLFQHGDAGRFERDEQYLAHLSDTVAAIMSNYAGADHSGAQPAPSASFKFPPPKDSMFGPMVEDFFLPDQRFGQLKLAKVWQHNSQSTLIPMTLSEASSTHSHDRSKAKREAAVRRSAKPAPTHDEGMLSFSTRTSQSNPGGQHISDSLPLFESGSFQNLSGRLATNAGGASAGEQTGATPVHTSVEQPARMPTPPAVQDAAFPTDSEDLGEFEDEGVASQLRPPASHRRPSSAGGQDPPRSTLAISELAGTVVDTVVDTVAPLRAWHEAVFLPTQRLPSSAKSEPLAFALSSSSSSSPAAAATPMAPTTSLRAEARFVATQAVSSADQRSHVDDECNASDRSVLVGVPVKRIEESDLGESEPRLPSSPLLSSPILFSANAQRTYPQTSVSSSSINNNWSQGHRRSQLMEPSLDPPEYDAMDCTPPLFTSPIVIPAGPTQPPANLRVVRPTDLHESASANDGSTQDTTDATAPATSALVPGEDEDEDDSGATVDGLHTLTVPAHTRLLQESEEPGDKPALHAQRSPEPTAPISNTGLTGVSLSSSLPSVSQIEAAAEEAEAAAEAAANEANSLFTDTPRKRRVRMALADKFDLVADAAEVPSQNGLRVTAEMSSSPLESLNEEGLDGLDGPTVPERAHATTSAKDGPRDGWNSSSSVSSSQPSVESTWRSSAPLPTDPTRSNQHARHAVNVGKNHPWRLSARIKPVGQSRKASTETTETTETTEGRSTVLGSTEFCLAVFDSVNCASWLRGEDGAWAACLSMECLASEKIDACCFVENDRFCCLLGRFCDGEMRAYSLADQTHTAISFPSELGVAKVLHVEPISSVRRGLFLIFRTQHSSLVLMACVFGDDWELLSTDTRDLPVEDPRDSDIKVHSFVSAPNSLAVYLSCRTMLFAWTLLRLADGEDGREQLCFASERFSFDLRTLSLFAKAGVQSLRVVQVIPSQPTAPPNHEPKLPLAPILLVLAAWSPGAEPSLGSVGTGALTKRVLLLTESGAFFDCEATPFESLDETTIAGEQSSLAVHSDRFVAIGSADAASVGIYSLPSGRQKASFRFNGFFSSERSDSSMHLCFHQSKPLLTVTIGRSVLVYTAS